MLGIIDDVATYHVQNFGCRATQADGAAIERQLLERGMQSAPTAKDAEVVVLNTCTVTASADQDARAAIRRVHRENPGAQILVTGCYAQRAPEELAAIPGVSVVVGNSHKHQIAQFVPLERTKEPRAHMHPGYEFLYILDGELELHHGEHHCTLGPGDAVYFDSSTPHSYICAGKKPADALIVTMHQAPAAQPVTLLRSGSGAAVLQRTVAGRTVLGPAGREGN